MAVVGEGFMAVVAGASMEAVVSMVLAAEATAGAADIEAGASEAARGPSVEEVTTAAVLQPAAI